MNGKPTEGKRIFASATYCRGLIHRLYKELKKQTDKKIKEPFKQMGGEWRVLKIREKI